jgi:outer membrane receptor for ferrienterochelin and colicins
MNFRSRLCVVSVAVLSMAIAHRSQAQEVNYGALEQMFGEPVTTSATGSPETASEVPADMLIISADEIRRSGATDIPDILRYYAGIDVRTEGALNNDVSIRGYAQPFNPRLLVLINGRQVYLDDYGYTAWQTLPVQLNDIRQIEVVRGPASALFGFNAASGVINIITYDPLFDKTNVLNFGLGTNGTYNGSLVSTLNEPGKGGITVQLGGLTTHEFNQSPIDAGGTVSSRPYEGSYAVDARYKPTSQTEVTLETTKSVANSSSQGSVYSYDTSMYRVESYKASVAADTGIGTITLLGYINQDTTSYHSTQDLFDVNQIDVVQLNDLFKVADVHAIKIGFEYRNNRGSGSLFNGSLHYNNFAGNAMWNWQIKPTLSFTAAGRVDHLELLRSDPLSSDDKYVPADYNGTSITTPSYNFGLVWDATDNDTFRLLTGRAVQAPSLLDLGFNLQLPEDGGLIKAVYAGNPNLIPSVSTNYELDYDRQLTQISSTLRTAVFFNTTRDLMADASGLPGNFAFPVFSSYSQNTGSGQAVGGELGITGSSDLGFRWNANYSLVGVRNKTDYGPPTAPAPFNNATPTSEINFGGGYSWRQWEADAEAHWQSNYQTDTYGYGPAGIFFTPVTVDNYITATARIGYAVNSHINLAVAGQALTKANQNGFGSMKPYQRVLFSATFTY